MYKGKARILKLRQELISERATSMLPFQSVFTEQSIFRTILARISNRERKRHFWSELAFFKTFSRLFQFAEKVKCRRISQRSFSWGPHSSLEREKPEIKARKFFWFANKIWNIGYCLFVGCVFLCKWWPQIGVLRQEIQVFRGHAILFSGKGELFFFLLDRCLQLWCPLVWNVYKEIASFRKSRRTSETCLKQRVFYADTVVYRRRSNDEAQHGRGDKGTRAD